MDIDALHSALLALAVLPEQIRAARTNRAASGHSLVINLERELSLAKARLAWELEIPVCGCCWPPQVPERLPEIISESDESSA